MEEIMRDNVAQSSFKILRIDCQHLIRELLNQNSENPK